MALGFEVFPDVLSVVVDISCGHSRNSLVVELSLFGSEFYSRELVAEIRRDISEHGIARKTVERLATLRRLAVSNRTVSP